jgi:hypothetical protein
MAAGMGDVLIGVTQGDAVGPCDLNATDLALLGAHVEDIGLEYAEQAGAEFDDGLAEPVRRYVALLFSGRYDPSDRELPNLSPAGYAKVHEVAVSAIIKAHRRNETKLYQTLMAYLRLTQADQADLAHPTAEHDRPRVIRSA